MNYKLTITGIVLIAAIVFGFWFWDQFTYNQQELANTPMESSQQTEDDSKSAEDSESLESELNELDLSGLDEEELDVSGL